MAEYLVRQWQLVVLKVRLDLSSRVPAIASQLVAHPDGQEAVLWSREDPLEAFGLPRGSDPPSRLRVPAELAADVSQVVRNRAASEDEESVLWLRLVPPYGYLGAVPWEDLTSIIHMPVLRVPDRLPVPVDFGPSWSAALVVSAPLRATWGADHVVTRIEALRRHVSTSWRVDVFADAHTHRLLTQEPDVFPSPWRRRVSADVDTGWVLSEGTHVLEGEVRLHDPSLAAAAHERRAASRRERTEAGRPVVRPLHEANLVWSDWIITALAGRAVRALHVVAQGAFDGDHPVITFTADPGDAVHGLGASATDDELCLLADVLGASLISFGSPSSRRSDLAIRMLADRIGQSRPGPTLYSSIRHDPTCDALASAEAFVAEPGRPVLVPQHRSLFGYIQPESVHPDLRRGWSDAASRTVYGTESPSGTGRSAKVPGWAGVAMAPGAHELRVTGMGGDSTAVPAWIASSARFIDTHRAELMNTPAPSPGKPLTAKRAYEEGMASALADIEDLIIRRAGEWR